MAGEHRVRRSNMPSMQYSYVCSDHFLPSCFLVNIRSQVTGEKCERRLKEDAVLSEFDCGREAKPRLSSENRLVRQRIEEFSILQYSMLQFQYTLPFVRPSNTHCHLSALQCLSVYIVRMICPLEFVLF